MKKENTLKKYRFEIDKIDEKILSLLAKRINISKKIGEHKLKNGLPIVDKKRKSEIFEKLQKTASKKTLSDELVKNIYKIIHDSSVDLQKNIKKL